jgi:hypothetical protein
MVPQSLQYESVNCNVMLRKQDVHRGSVCRRDAVYQNLIFRALICAGAPDRSRM